MPAAVGRAEEARCIFGLYGEGFAASRPGSGAESGATWPRLEVAAAAKFVGSHEVGLRVKLADPASARPSARRRGMPCRIFGKGSETARAWAVWDRCRARCGRPPTPRSKGPATAGVTIDQGERRALVGAGEVDVALDVEGGRAGAGADVDDAHFRVRRAAGIGLLERAFVGRAARLAAAIWASEQASDRRAWPRGPAVRSLPRPRSSEWRPCAARFTTAGLYVAAVGISCRH